jgi:hypothetical protein
MVYRSTFNATRFKTTQSISESSSQSRAEHDDATFEHKRGEVGLQLLWQPLLQGPTLSREGLLGILEIFTSPVWRRLLQRLAVILAQVALLSH